MIPMLTCLCTCEDCPMNEGWVYCRVNCMSDICHQLPIPLLWEIYEQKLLGRTYVYKLCTLTTVYSHHSVLSLQCTLTTVYSHSRVRFLEFDVETFVRIHSRILMSNTFFWLEIVIYEVLLTFRESLLVLNQLSTPTRSLFTVVHCNCRMQKLLYRQQNEESALLLKIYAYH